MDQYKDIENDFMTQQFRVSKLELTIMKIVKKRKKATWEKRDIAKASMAEKNIGIHETPINKSDSSKALPPKTQTGKNKLSVQKNSAKLA